MREHGWRLFYPDGSAFGPELGTWADAPDGVAVVVIFHAPPYRTIEAGEDEYRLPGRKTAKRGATVDDEALGQLQALAVTTPPDNPPYPPDSGHGLCGGAGMHNDGRLCGCTFRRY